MKKKNILFLIFTVVIGVLLLGTVNAKTVDRIATDGMPPSGRTTFAYTDNAFTDFNKIAFKASSGDENIAVPTNNSLRKIVMGGLSLAEAKTFIEDDTIKDLYFHGNLSGSEALHTPKFSGYSLSNNPYYPSWSLINTSYEVARQLLEGLELADHNTGLLTLGQLALFQGLNDGTFNNVLSSYKDKTIVQMALAYTFAAKTNDPNEPVLTNLTNATTTFTYVPGNPEPTVSAAATNGPVLDQILASGATPRLLGDGAAAHIIGNKIVKGDSFPVYVSALIVVTSDGPNSIKAEDICGQATCTITINPGDIFFDEYEDSTTDTGKPNYNHALWILEHSYPTLSFDDALIMAGINKTALINEVKGLFGTAAPYDTYTDAEWTKMAEDYVYFVTQYAIYKSVGATFNSKTLGNEIVPASGTASVTNLDTLYKYYNQDRDEYTDYDKKKFTNKDKKIELNDELAKDKKPKESGDYYLYGPYSLTYGFLSSDDVTVTIAEENKTDKSITDKDGNEKSGNIASGEEFYIKVKKSANISGVKIAMSTDHAYTIPDYEDNRGVVYYPHNKLLKDIVAGGVYTNLGSSPSDTKDIVFNPKTGVENVAIVFVITLIAFSLGYLVLNYKNNPVELN